jgi:hypothetical protein
MGKIVFTSTTFDKIRKAFAAGKRTYVHDGRKFNLSLQKRRWILVKPADGSLQPMANIETVRTREGREKFWREQGQKLGK